MTCIAWDGNTLASDSQCTDNCGMYLTRTPKLFRLKGGALIGTAGDDDCREVMELFDNVKDENDFPSRGQMAATHTNFGGLLVLPNKVVYSIDIGYQELGERLGGQWDGSITRIYGKYAIMGSGGSYAMGAMVSGASAVDAVKAACKLDSFCSLPVQTMIPGASDKKSVGHKTAKSKKKIVEVPTELEGTD